MNKKTHTLRRADSGLYDVLIDGYEIGCVAHDRPGQWLAHTQDHGQQWFPTRREAVAWLVARQREET